MNWFECLLYGIVSGTAEFLPISSSAHQQLLLKLFGQNGFDPLQNLVVHLALLLSVFVGSRNLIEQLRHHRQARLHNPNAGRNTSTALETRFLSNSVVPFLALYFVLLYGIKIKINLIWIALFSLINGALLFSNSRMMQGNKDERLLSVFDSVLIGISGALSVFSGISRIAVMLTVFTARGVGRQKAVNWLILLSIPALFLMSATDILNIISNTNDVIYHGNVLGYILSGLGAYAAGYTSIFLIKSLVTRKDLSGFAYYSWGFSLFTFIMYLTVV